jgi:hypothetical protein
MQSVNDSGVTGSDPNFDNTTGYNDPNVDAGQVSQVTVDGDLNGTLEAQGAGHFTTLTVNGKVSAPSPTSKTGGTIFAIDKFDPTKGEIDSLILNELDGTVKATDAIQSLIVQVLNGSLTTGQLGTSSTSISVGQINQTGQLTATQTQGSVSFGTVAGTVDLGALTASTTIGSVPAGSTVKASSVKAPLTITGDLAGTLNVAGVLQSLTVTGATPGVIKAGQIGTITAATASSPMVAQIQENGIQRLIETTATSTPTSTPVTSPAPSSTPITFQYFYEGQISPSVENPKSTATLANPQVTFRVLDPNPPTNQPPAPYDLSFIVYSDTAKFNLARLDSIGPSFINSVDVEGDILTSITPAAKTYFSLSTMSGGVQLGSDAIAGVFVRDYVPAGAIQAKSVEAISFGSYTEGKQTATGASASAGDAAGLLAATTKIVPAGATFRVPFADLATQQVGFFFDDQPTPGPGKFDPNNVVFTVEALPANFQPASTGGPSRGSDTALVTIGPISSPPKKSPTIVIGAIAIGGDGASIQTQQWVSGPITSTGPLGDLTLQSNQPITAIAASGIFGTINAEGTIGSIITTGFRLDPITGAKTVANGDFGRIYTNSKGKTVSTSLDLQSEPTGAAINVAGNLLTALEFDGDFTGTITTGGDIGSPTLAIPIVFNGHANVVMAVTGSLYSPVTFDDDFNGQVAVGKNIGAIAGSSTVGGMVFNGDFNGQVVALGSIIAPMTLNGEFNPGAVIATQGDLGAFLPGGTTRMGGVVFNDDFEGQLLVLGNAIGDVTLQRGMNSGSQIGVKGTSSPNGAGILGNLTVNGMSNGATIVSDGIIGSSTLKTTLTVNGKVGGTSIIAAKSAINFSSTPTSGYIFSNNSNGSAMVIDSVFTSNNTPPFSNMGLTQLLMQLGRIRVAKNGNLLDT